MSACTNPQLGAKLHAYELGLLSDEECRELEQHMLECPECDAKAEAFESAAGILRDSPKVRDVVQSALEGSPEEDQVSDQPRGGWWRRTPSPRFYVPALAAAAVLLVLVLSDWQLEFRPGKEAVAFENRIAVMYFDNLADPDDKAQLAAIATHMLITDLSESRYLQVVSSQRLYDILKQLGREGTTTIDRETASEVAVKSQAKWMLLGHIVQSEPQIAIATEIIEVTTGNTVASQQVTGDSAETLFSVIDRLTADIKASLSLPQAALEEHDPAIAEITTHSQEAYHLFLAGIDHWFAKELDSAQQNFRTATELDSTFAMAYWGLALTQWGYLRDEPGRTLIETAARHVDHVSRRERYYILGTWAFVQRDKEKAGQYFRQLLEEFPDEKLVCILLARIGPSEEALLRLKRVIELDPSYGEAYDRLAQLYNDRGDYDDAVWMARKHVELEPDQADAYNTLGLIYRTNGKLRLAISAYEQALAIDPELYDAVEGMGICCQLDQQFTRADSLYHVLAMHPDKNLSWRGRDLQTSVLIHQGRFREALRLHGETVAWAREAFGPGIELSVILFQQPFVTFGMVLNEYDSALAVIDMAMPMMTEARPVVGRLTELGLKAAIYAKMGDLERAEKLREELKQVPGLEARPSTYLYLLCWSEFEAGNFAEAIQYGEELLELDGGPGDFLDLATLARCHLEAGHLASAVELYERAHSHYDYLRAFHAQEEMLSHYYLGRAYEASGWTDRAIEQYRIFYDLWQNADPMVPQVEDARLRLARLAS